MLWMAWGRGDTKSQDDLVLHTGGVCGRWQNVCVVVE